jgi:hypothetical protein
MPSDDTLNRVSRSNSFKDGPGTRQSDRDTAVYVEDGWIFRVKPGAPIECMRATSCADTVPQVDQRDQRP